MVQSSEIAVLIPAYSPGSYIFDCFRSLAAQDLPSEKFSVYIALNGPKEPFYSTLINFLSNNALDWQLFYLENPGVSNARNFLIENSVEPYICFLDDDDLLSENYLSSLLSVAGEETVGVSNVKVFDKNVCDSKVNYIGKCYSKMESKEVSIFRVRQYFSSPCAKIIHRNIIDIVRFDINLSKGEDGFFMAEISPRVVCIKKGMPESCYYVFQRPGSAIRKHVKVRSELLRISYLIRRYAKMLFLPRYNKRFITSRILATLIQAKKVFSS